MPSPGVFPTPAEVQGIVAFLQPGGRVVALLGPPGSGTTELMAEILAALPGRAIRVANPLASPLTAGRVLLQIGGESTAEEDGEAIVRCLDAQVGGLTPATLAIDDAQTLDADMVQVLSRLPGLKGEHDAGMNLVLCADAAWWRALPVGHDTALKDPAHAMVVSLGEAAARLPALVAVREAAMVVAREQRAPRSAAVVSTLVVVLLLLGAAALVFRPDMSPPPHNAVSVKPMTASPDPVTAPPPLAPSAATPTPTPTPTPTTTAPAAPVAADPAPQAATPAPAALPSDGASPPPSEAQLRADFAVFLSRAGRDTASLTPEAAEALFREYLAWRAGSGSEPAKSVQAGAPP